MTYVLIVDDERDLAELVAFNLKQAGFETAVAHTGEEALALVKQRAPDLVLLDLMLPDLSGTEVCRQLKAGSKTRAVPVVMLTAKGEEMDRVVGFEVGADDYVTKPFSVRELVLRLKAVLRRFGAPDHEAGTLVLGLLRLDTDAHRCFVEDEEIPLTVLEFRLIEHLMVRKGRVQSRERLLMDVWGISSRLETRTIDTHVMRLREKLGKARACLETVRGVGYRMSDPAED
jgi:two-component system, OmpR family, phosphate regulon response regulator PhoB